MVCDVGQESGKLEQDELKEYESDDVVHGVSFVGLGTSFG